MKYLESESTDPYYNLALEEYLFEHLPKNEEYFMLWQNSPSVIVGKYQNTAEEVNADYVRTNGIKVVRRITGGGAVYHDLGNLNYSFIVNAGESSAFDFGLFAVPVIRTLRKFGIDAVLSGRNDLTIGGRKFCGNSQCIRNRRLLHHGCIMVDSNLSAVSRSLKTRAAKFVSKATKSVRSRVTTINENAKDKITVEMFRETLKKEVFSEHEVSYYTLDGDDKAVINKLAVEKYATWEWNFGASPEYDMERTEKFDSGFVSVKMKVRNGIIEDIGIYGDFFGNGDIRVIQDALRGAKISENLEEKLSGIDLNDFINGVSTQELCGLLR